MVEVFKTNVNDKPSADTLCGKLKALLPEAKINFDLEDCDRILRIEDPQNRIQLAIQLLVELGYCCEILDG